MAVDKQSDNEDSRDAKNDIRRWLELPTVGQRSPAKGRAFSIMRRYHLGAVVLIIAVIVVSIIGVLLIAAIQARMSEA